MINITKAKMYVFRVLFISKQLHRLFSHLLYNVILFSIKYSFSNFALLLWRQAEYLMSGFSIAIDLQALSRRFCSAIHSWTYSFDILCTDMDLTIVYH